MVRLEKQKQRALAKEQERLAILERKRIRTEIKTAKLIELEKKRAEKERKRLEKKADFEEFKA